MRVKPSGSVLDLSVRAIVGPHVVILAWDVRPGAWDTFTAGLLGFAIERTEFRAGSILEHYFLRGIKRFEFKDKGLPAGTPVPTSEHPVQSFQWGDYTVAPERRYRYRVIPVYGAPKNLELRDAAATSVEFTTPDALHDGHAVYFNRGAAGSQAYAREFSNPVPDETKPNSKQMKWLSRGLYEALIDFIGRANGPAFALRGAFYEFRYPPVIKAFKLAANAGADVKILYDKPNYGAKNRAVVSAGGLTPFTKERAGVDSEKHNKFLILLKNDAPVAVWTGSTNISAGGIFGHSNVGHVVERTKAAAAIARKYLDYWNFLWNAPDSPNGPIVQRNNQETPTPAGKPAPNSTIVMFSPREAKTLNWYADRMNDAQSLVCFTVAFTIAKVFADVLKQENDVLRYVLKDKNSASDAAIEVDRDVLVAAGAKFGAKDLANFRPEELTGFNKNQYIHDKFLLIDPLSDDPLVITGSANFSPTSTTKNDENMLVIRGSADLADTYFGEFMRIFDHIYARHIITRKLTAAQREQGRRNYLAESNEWTRSHAAGPKARRRAVFHGAWS